MLNRDGKCQLHLFCSQGLCPGLFGALQFMAYEKLKKGYSRYFRVHQSIKNKSVVSGYSH